MGPVGAYLGTNKDPYELLSQITLHKQTRKQMWEQLVDVRPFDIYLAVVTGALESRREPKPPHHPLLSIAGTWN